MAAPRIVGPADPGALDARARRGFASRWGREATLCASAPGRVNLIGEHTDYNDGLVLPMAISRGTAVAAAPRSDTLVRIASARAEGLVELRLDEPILHGLPRWGDYVRGVLAGALASATAPGGAAAGAAPRGFDAWIESDVPVGAGLSSSAALEVALATALEGLWDLAFEPIEKARLCQAAERDFAAVPCGIMDQAASVLASESAALLLDCRTLAWERIAIPDGLRFLVVDSRLPHDLGQGEFARRVAECREAARLLGVATLRDATPTDADSLAADGRALLARRVAHVVAENARVLAFAHALRTNDRAALGAVLDEGHASLRDLYEVSCPAMDELVATLQREGALGARMTGGGFGGCAVALLDDDPALLRRIELALQ